MSSLVLLEKSRHQGLKIDVEKAEAHAADERMMPVVMSEFLKLAVHYPIVVTKNAETGSFVCVALLGFEKGENLFWKNQGWDAIYTPLNVQRQPFFVGNDSDSEAAQSGSEKSERFVICLNSASDSLVKNTAAAERSDARQVRSLFHEDGSETDYLQRIRTVLSELLTGEQQTRQFVATLAEMKLLTPVALDITFANGDAQRVEGIYSIDEEGLNSLSGEAILQLRSSGYLSSIYTMLVSLGQLYSLIERKNRMLEKGSAWFQKRA